MLSDDIRTHSGVGGMAREIIINSAHHYNWVNLGGAVKHPEAGQGFDLSQDINRAIGIEDADVKVVVDKQNNHIDFENVDITKLIFVDRRPH